MRTEYRITVMERECPADDFDTESGQGMPDDTEVVERDIIEVPGDETEAALADLGISQWDGGSTTYDPDGTHMAMDGTISERFGKVEAI